MKENDHRSTRRVLDIFDLLARQERGLTLTEICERLDAPKGSLFPILRTMERARYLNFDETAKRYDIGLKTYLVGSSYMNNNDELKLIFSEMKDVVAVCEETCQLGKLDGGQVLYVGKEDSPLNIRLVSAVGKTLPAYCTAIGKCLLYEHSKERLRSLYYEPLKQETPNTITDIDQLYEQLQKVRHAGLAYDFEETIEDVVCVATPLVKNGEIIYGLGVSAPSFRFDDEKRERVERLLLKAKHRIEKLMR